MRKRIMPLLLIAILVVAVALVGCSGSGNDAKTDGGDAGGDTGGGTAEPITIKVNSFLPEGNTLSTGTLAAIENIEKFSNGELKGEGYFNGTVLDFFDSWEGTGKGTVDVSFIGPAILGQYSRLLDGLQLMYNNLQPDFSKTMLAFNEQINTHEEYAKDLEKHNLKVLYIQGVPGSAIHSVKSDIKVPADMKGLVINAIGKNSSDFFSSLGATTVTLDFGEYMISAQRGVADAFLDGWGAMYDSQTLEVVKSHTIFGEFTEEFPSGGGLSSAPMTYVVNLDTWNKLSESQQEALTKAFAEGAALVPAAEAEASKASYDVVTERGDLINVVDSEGFKAWFDAYQPVTDAWIAEMDAQGYDGKKLYDDMQACIDKFQ